MKPEAPPAQPPAAATSQPAYSGPRSGAMVWSGQLEKDGLVTIENGQASAGSLRGELSAQVLTPEQFAGETIEGVVKESKGSGKVKGKSVLNFTFQTLNRAGNAVAIDSQVKSVINSKGKTNVDEEGRAGEKKNNIGKVAAATAGGALLGAIIGGGKGAAIGAGVRAAASLVFIEVATKGAQISFAPGSEFILSVKERR